MKLLKNWTKFEKVFIFASTLTVSIFSIIFKSDVLTTICSLVGIITVLLIAKGKNSGQIWGIIFTILYSIISYKNKYYGEVIIYTFLMLPMFIIGIIEWIKYKNLKTDSVEINILDKKEWLVIAIVVPVLFTGLYFLLMAFNTDELIISTISALTSLLGIYLQIRRTRASFTFYMINDIILILLWGVPLIKGNYILLPMVLNPIFILIDDIYGIHNWKKLI